MGTDSLGGQQAELRVRQAQVRFDRLDQDREDLPIERVQRVDPDEKREGKASGSRIGAHGRARLRPTSVPL